MIVIYRDLDNVHFDILLPASISSKFPGRVGVINSDELYLFRAD